MPLFIYNLIRDYKYDLKKLNETYAGTGVECPICKSEFRIFANYGLKNRKNAWCIKCFSLERHRLLWKYLHEKTDLFTTKKSIKLLHFAPEHFFYDLFSRRDNIEYYPVDLAPEMYTYPGSTKIHKVDITDMPYEDNFFDMALCNHVFEHVPNDKHAMSELFRVLDNKKGWGIFQSPIDYNLNYTLEDPSITDPLAREKAFGQNDHLRLYGKDYETRLELAGFKVIIDGYINSFSEDEINKYGFRKDELIYKCIV